MWSPLPPVSHSSNHQYHCCQLTRQSSCGSNCYRTFKVFIWLSLVYFNEKYVRNNTIPNFAQMKTPNTSAASKFTQQKQNTRGCPTWKPLKKCYTPTVRFTASFVKQTTSPITFKVAKNKITNVSSFLLCPQIGINKYLCQKHTFFPTCNASGKHFPSSLCFKVTLY